MNDLISRQAAIDALVDRYNVAKWDRNPKTEELVWTLERLPSVKPEIIQCKDCKYYVKDYGWNCIEYTVCSISPLHHPLRKPNDYCSRAKRRTDE